MSQKPMVIAYDISSPKRRRKVRKILYRWRFDGQKSVHECRLTTKQAEELLLQIGPLLNPATDCLLMAWVDATREVLYGGSKPASAKSFRWITRK